MRSTDIREPLPRSREVFSFHRPDTLPDRIAAGKSIRRRLLDISELNREKLPVKQLGMRDCQELAITHLEPSFNVAHPRALVQMGTGSGKTFTAITSVYRLLK